MALPLVALAQTGSGAATGLVAGAAGVPVLLGPWWTRRLRPRVASARRVGQLNLAAAVVVGTLPLAAAADLMTPALLAVVGLVHGALSTLTVPARAGLLADLGDELGPHGAARLLTWHDTGVRLAMVVGPAAAALLVAWSGLITVLVTESVGYLLAGVLALAVPGTRAAAAHRDAPEGGAAGPVPRIRDSVAGKPDLVRCWIIRGTGCLGWFAFSLGLPLLGAGSDIRSGAGLAAAGFAAHGVAGLVGAPAALRSVRWTRSVVVSGAGWAGGGLAFVLIGLYPTPPVVVAAAALAGLAVPIGNAGATAALIRATRGSERIAALAGQQVVVWAAGSAGLLLGAPLIAVIGPAAMLVSVGVAIVAVAVTVPVLPRRWFGDSQDLTTVTTVGSRATT